MSSLLKLVRLNNDGILLPLLKPLFAITLDKFRFICGESSYASLLATLEAVDDSLMPCYGTKIIHARMPGQTDFLIVIVV